MSAPLKDFRTALSEATLAALEAEAIAFDRDMQSIARDILTEWARRKHRAYTVYAKRVLANGAQADLPWNDAENDGSARSRRR